jgi:hypothetical protein
MLRPSSAGTHAAVMTTQKREVPNPVAVRSSDGGFA